MIMVAALMADLLGMVKGEVSVSGFCLRSGL
jgi:hypothetical protein